MKNLLPVIIFLTAMCLLMGFPDVRASEMDETRFDTTFEKRSLLEILEEMGRKYDVLVSYETSVVKDVEIDFEFIPDEDLESAFNRLLEDSKFSFELLQGKFVLVYKNDQYNRKTARKIRKKIRQLDKLQERSSLRLAPKQVNKKDQMRKLVRFIQEETIGIDISGIVTDESGEPLIGVNIQVKGTNQGAATDFDGRFTLENINENAVLIISYIGYQTQEVEVGSNTSLSIVLQPDSQLLDEVVVVGYGTQKKANLTGAVDQVGDEVFENRPMPNVTQGLQGVIPNLNITLADGKPYRSANYQIRGLGSIGQGGSALVLIDGVEGDPTTLNPNDISSVSVLKDAASAAIYGARGAFGVVLITTKNPEKGRTSVTYSGNFSMKAPTFVPDMVTDPLLYTDMYVEAYSAYYDYSRLPSTFHRSVKYSEDWHNELRKHTAGSGLPDVVVADNGEYQYFATTDWWDLLYKDQILGHEHNLSIQRGGENASFMVSARNYNQGGLFNYNSDDYSTINLRAKGSAKIFNWLTIENNLNFSREKYFYPINVSGGVIWYGLLNDSAPMVPMFNPDGTLTMAAAYSVGDLWYGKSGINTGQNVLRNTSSFTASFFSDVFRVRGDFSFRNSDREQTTKRVPVPYSNAVDEISYLGSTTNDLTIQNTDGNYLAANLYTEYENTFSGGHYFKGLLGYNYEQSQRGSISTRRNGLLFPDAESLSLTNGGGITIDNSYSKWRIAGGFFRFNYNFKERYLLEFNGRMDGSSKFPVNQQWGFFPSVSAGWRITEEPFWNVNSNAVSNLKIRASYGSLGNGNVGPYTYQELFNIRTMDRLIHGTLNQQTSTPTVIPNGLTWETSTTTDVGLDVELLNTRLQFTGDVYIRKTKNMFAVGVDLPAVFGATPPKGNYADMTTKGWELSLRWQDLFNLGNKPFQYHIRATLSDYLSTIDRYTNPQNDLGSYWDARFNYYEGMTLGEIWGYETEGFFTSEEDIQNHADQNIYSPSSTKTWLPGDIKYRDLNNDGVISYGDNTVDNPGDRRIIGNTSPRYAFGLNLGADWNHISFSIFFQGIGQQHWWPGTDNALFWGQYNRPYDMVPKSMLGEIWSEENPDTYFPRYRGYVALQSSRELAVVQTRYLQNVAYIRLKNLRLGYDFSGDWLSRAKIQRAQLYVSGVNLWSWSPLYKYENSFDVGNIYGEDQDSNAAIQITGGIGGGISNGSQTYNYPILKGISFGLSVTF